MTKRPRPWLNGKRGNMAIEYGFGFSEPNPHNFHENPRDSLRQTLSGAPKGTGFWVWKAGSAEPECICDATAHLRRFAVWCIQRTIDKEASRLAVLLQAAEAAPPKEYAARIGFIADTAASTKAPINLEPNDDRRIYAVSAEVRRQKRWWQLALLLSPNLSN